MKWRPSLSQRSRGESKSIRSTLGLVLLAAVDVEEVELVRGELVAGQRVRARSQPGPAAAGGRRLDQVDFLAIAGLDPEGDQRLANRAPTERRP